MKKKNSHNIVWFYPERALQKAISASLLVTPSHQLFSQVPTPYPLFHNAPQCWELRGWRIIIIVKKGGNEAVGQHSTCMLIEITWTRHVDVKKIFEQMVFA